MKKIKAPWNLTQPSYDDRSSCYVNVGSHYGVGKTQPIGSKTASNRSPIPKGKNFGMKVDNVSRKPLSIEVEL